jgi:hypothetical protein
MEKSVEEDKNNESVNCERSVKSRNRETEAVLRAKALHPTSISNVLALDCGQQRTGLKKCLNGQRCCSREGITQEVIMRFRSQLWDPPDDYGTPVEYRKCKLMSLISECCVTQGI